MSLFRINPDNPTRGPHQNQPAEEYGPSLSRAKAAMIMMHGRGATAKSMLPLAEQLAQPDFFYIAPQAKHHTWYPYSFLESQEKNKAGIMSGLQVIYDLLQNIRETGLEYEKMILLGFSQGACLALDFITRHPQTLGGVAALSGALIGKQISEKDYTGNLHKTPVFIGCDEKDPYVPMNRLHLTSDIIHSLNGKVNKQIYRDMGHKVNEHEIKIIRGMMASILQD